MNDVSAERADQRIGREKPVDYRGRIIRRVTDHLAAPIDQTRSVLRPDVMHMLTRPVDIAGFDQTPVAIPVQVVGE
jgi:hypothetical protein